MSFADEVVAVVAATSPGQVLTYGEVAAEAGRPGAARAVGAVLRARGGDLPWWRVVTASGRLVPGNEVAHAAHLAEEGVPCRDGLVLAVRRPDQGARGPRIDDGTGQNVR